MFHPKRWPRRLKTLLFEWNLTNEKISVQSKGDTEDLIIPAM